MGGRKSPFPITLAISLYNSLYYRTCRDLCMLFVHGHQTDQQQFFLRFTIMSFYCYNYIKSMSFCSTTCRTSTDSNVLRSDLHLGKHQWVALIFPTVPDDRFPVHDVVAVQIEASQLGMGTASSLVPPCTQPSIGTLISTVPVLGAELCSSVKIKRITCTKQQFGICICCSVISNYQHYIKQTSCGVNHNNLATLR